MRREEQAKGSALLLELKSVNSANYKKKARLLHAINNADIKILNILNMLKFPMSLPMSLYCPIQSTFNSNRHKSVKEKRKLHSKISAMVRCLLIHSVHKQSTGTSTL